MSDHQPEPSESARTRLSRQESTRADALLPVVEYLRKGERIKTERRKHYGSGARGEQNRERGCRGEWIETGRRGGEEQGGALKGLRKKRADLGRGDDVHDVLVLGCPPLFHIPAAERGQCRRCEKSADGPLTTAAARHGTPPSCGRGGRVLARTAQGSRFCPAQSRAHAQMKGVEVGREVEGKRVRIEEREERGEMELKHVRAIVRRHEREDRRRNSTMISVRESVGEIHRVEGRGRGEERQGGERGRWALSKRRNEGKTGGEE
eukprot:3900911-Pleurochrysis_carterae.AAC.3